MQSTTLKVIGVTFDIEYLCDKQDAVYENGVMTAPSVIEIDIQEMNHKGVDMIELLDGNVLDEVVSLIIKEENDSA